MSKRQLLCVIGVWVMIFLFLGFPSMWHKIIAVLSGLAIIIISYNLPPDIPKTGDKEAFIENKVQ